VLSAPLVSAVPTRPLAFIPAPSHCHRVPASVASHLSAAAPRHARRLPCPRDVRCPPLSERPRATAPMPCWLTRRCTPTPPSPLLSYRHAAPSWTPLPFSSPPRRRTAIKRRHPTPSLVSPFFLSQVPVHRTSSPTSFPVMPRPPTGTERRRTTPVSAPTAPLPAFIGERCPKL
jgi:hypothetical protein